MRVFIYSVILMFGVACQSQRDEQRGVLGKKPVPSASFYAVPLSEAQLVTNRVMYVPIYSYIALPGAQTRMLSLSATLSIRNTDPHQRIIITAVEYYDTNGALVESYVTDSFALGPLASTEVILPQVDTGGGTGASFLVKWGAEAAVSPPVIEAIMAGAIGNYSFAFARSGRVIQPIPLTR